MNLKYLTMENCPDCGSPAKREEFGYTHVNGGREEYKEFECGKMMHFIPNALPRKWIKETHSCTRSIIALLKEEKKKEAKEAIQQFIEKLDVDDEWKNELLWRLGWGRATARRKEVILQRRRMISL